MKNYIVTASPQQQYQFEVEKISIGTGSNCKYDVYQQGKFIASLEPDGFDFLRICQNLVDMDLEILHLLAEQILDQELSSRLSDDLSGIEFDRDDEMEAPPQKTPLD